MCAVFSQNRSSALDKTIRFQLLAIHVPKETRKQTSLFRITRSSTAAVRDAKHKLAKFAPAWQHLTAATAARAALNAILTSSPPPSSNQPSKTALSLKQLRSGVLDGSIAYAAYDTACTSHA